MSKRQWIEGHNPGAPAVASISKKGVKPIEVILGNSKHSTPHIWGSRKEAMNWAEKLVKDPVWSHGTWADYLYSAGEIRKALLEPQDVEEWVWDCQDEWEDEVKGTPTFTRNGKFSCGANVYLGSYNDLDFHLCDLDEGHDGAHHDSGLEWTDAETLLSKRICRSLYQGKACVLPYQHEGFHQSGTDYPFIRWPEAEADFPSTDADTLPPEPTDLKEDGRCSHQLGQYRCEKDTRHWGTHKHVREVQVDFIPNQVLLLWPDEESTNVFPGQSALAGFEQRGNGWYPKHTEQRDSSSDNPLLGQVTVEAPRGSDGWLSSTPRKQTESS